MYSPEGATMKSIPLVAALAAVLLASCGRTIAGSSVVVGSFGEPRYISVMPLPVESAIDPPLITAGLGSRPIAPADTTPAGATQTMRSKLLPENISWMEKALWGENGFVRTIGIASPLTPEVRKHELAVRRTMLSLHQIGGFVTLASMITTVYYGQKYLNTGDPNYRDMHKTFIPITIGLYATTGLLSILSPPPLIRRDNETSTTTIHKTLAWVHFAGMILTPILGKALKNSGASYDTQARYHQVAAYVTTAAFAAAMITVTF
jgi:hypothetical protein